MWDKLSYCVLAVCGVVGGYLQLTDNGQTYLCAQNMMKTQNTEYRQLVDYMVDYDSVVRVSDDLVLYNVSTQFYFPSTGEVLRTEWENRKCWDTQEALDNWRKENG